jgi:tagatose 6-phosphate kinase
MILVVCLNPALDITHHVEHVDWAGVNRPTDVHLRPGGKGVNVARTLYALGADVVLLGLAEWDEFRAQYSRVLAVAARQGPAAVVLSGSLPPGLPVNAYAVLIAMAEAAGVPTLLDSSGAALQHGIAAGPHIVKPNLDELAALTAGGTHDSGRLGTRQCAQTSTIMSAAIIREAGARSVVVSLGPDGLLALTSDGCWQARSAAVLAGNATGAGDSVVAALAHGVVHRRPSHQPEQRHQPQSAGQERKAL